jgi:hypothetical protein
MDIRDSVALSKCETCPRVLHALQGIEDVTFHGQLLTDMVIDDGAEEVANMVYETLQASGVNDLLSDTNGNRVQSGQDLLATIRKQTAARLDYIDERNAEQSNKIEELIARCDGPLKMRATKLGQIITVTVCASPSQDMGFSCEDVHVNRSPSQ